MGIMYDACNPFNIPSDAGIVAGYVDGGCEWSQAGWDRFPHAAKVTITVTGGVADVLDVENGAATPAEVPGWVTARRAEGRTPTVYTDLAEWPACKQACANAGIAEPDWWIAQWQSEPDPSIPAGAVAHQYQGGVGAAYDVSSTVPDWPVPATPPGPPPPNPDPVEPPWEPVPNPAPPGPPTIEGDDMERFQTAVKIESGYGWSVLPNGVTVDQVVSAFMVELDPEQVNAYTAVPTWFGLTSDARLVFGPTAGKPIPDGDYGVVLWVAKPVAAPEVEAEKVADPVAEVLGEPETVAQGDSSVPPNLNE